MHKPAVSFFYSFFLWEIVEMNYLIEKFHSWNEDCCTILQVEQKELGGCLCFD